MIDGLIILFRMKKCNMKSVWKASFVGNDPKVVPSGKSHVLEKFMYLLRALDMAHFLKEPKGARLPLHSMEPRRRTIAPKQNTPSGSSSVMPSQYPLPSNTVVTEELDDDLSSGDLRSSGDNSIITVDTVLVSSSSQGDANEQLNQSAEYFKALSQTPASKRKLSDDLSGKGGVEKNRIEFFNQVKTLHRPDHDAVAHLDSVEASHLLSDEDPFKSSSEDELANQSEGFVSDGDSDGHGTQETNLEDDPGQFQIADDVSDGDNGSREYYPQDDPGQVQIAEEVVVERKAITRSQIEVVVQKSTQIEHTIPLLQVKVPPLIKKRFCLEDNEIVYDRLPLFMKDKIGFIVSWEGRHDSRILVLVDSLASRSSLFTTLAGEMRIACRRHFDEIVLIAAEKALKRRDLSEIQRVINELGYMRGNMPLASDEREIEDLEEELNAFLEINK